MRTATPEMAKKINELTYRLYKLEGKENPQRIISYQLALELTYEVAEDMINDLKKDVVKTEYTNLYIRMIDPMCDLKYQPYIKRSVSYIKPISAQANLDKNTITIETDDYKTIKVDLSRNKRIVSVTEHISFKAFFEIIKRTIDSNGRVNIYEHDQAVFIHTENEAVDKQIEYFMSLFNRILKTTDKKLPIPRSDKKQVKFRIEDTLSLLEVRDKALYDIIAPNIGYSFNPGYLHRLADQAKSNIYGLYYEDDNKIIQIS